MYMHVVIYTVIVSHKRRIKLMLSELQDDSSNQSPFPPRYSVDEGLMTPEVTPN